MVLTTKREFLGHCLEQEKVHNSIKHFVHVFGLRYSDGCIYEQKNNNSFTFYICFGKEKNAEKFVKDCKDYWGIDLNWHYSTRAYYVYLPADIARLMISLGSPIGRKTSQLFRIPKWVFRLSKELKWEFISGFFSGDGDTPRLKSNMNSSESLGLSLSSEENIVNQFCKGFMKDIWKLLSDLNIGASKPKIKFNCPRISKEGIITYPIEIRILTKKENMIKLLSNIKYRYNIDYHKKAEEVLSVLKGRRHLLEFEEYIKFYNKKKPSNIWVLLDKDVQKELIIKSAENISNKSKYVKLAKYLKNVCPSFKNVKLSSIRDNYVFDWRDKERFMPLDCFIELGELCKEDPNHLKNNIKRIKFKNVSNKFSIEVSKLR